MMQLKCAEKNIIIVLSAQPSPDVVRATALRAANPRAVRQVLDARIAQHEHGAYHTEKKCADELN